MHKQNPVLGIVRSSQCIDLESVVSALFDGGLEMVEVTLNTPGALDAVRRCSSRIAAGQHLGCGTVKNPQDARDACDAGAGFLVTPTLDPETIAYAASRETPIIPGALTPTEMHQATQQGAFWVKLFPASIFQPRYLRDVLAPLPELEVMPTGGVTLDSLGDWLEAGACAVGVGSSLMRAEWLENNDYRSIRGAAESWTERAASLR